MDLKLKIRTHEERLGAVDSSVRYTGYILYALTTTPITDSSLCKKRRAMVQAIVVLYTGRGLPRVFDAVSYTAACIILITNLLSFCVKVVELNEDLDVTLTDAIFHVSNAPSSTQFIRYEWCLEEDCGLVQHF